MFLLTLLGGLSLHSGSVRVPSAAQQKRRLGLLALIAIGSERGLSRDRLQAYLWPESSSDRSRHALDQLVYATRTALGVDPISSEGRELRLDRVVIDTDVRAFSEAVHDERWADAISAYGGPLLDGFHLSDCRDLESWIDAERSKLEQQYRKALETVARQSAAEGDHGAAIARWRTLAVSDPLSSRVATEVVQALENAGDRPGAIQHARDYQQLVRSELGVEADPQFEDLVTALARPRIIEASRLASFAERETEPEDALRGNDAAEEWIAKAPAVSRVGPMSRRTVALVALVTVALGSFSAMLLSRGWKDHDPGAARTRAIDPEARSFHLMGMNAWNERSKDGLDSAVVFFRRAIEIDPLYADAHAGLANAYVLLGYFGYRPADAMFPKAKSAALRAIELDGTLAAAHSALGMELTGEHDFAAAESAFKRAIAADSTYATAHQWYGILLMILGRVPEAVSETRRAAELDPLSLQIQNNYGTFLGISGEHAAALGHYQKVVGEEPDSAWVRRNPWLLMNMSGAYAANGQYEKALRFAERAVEINPRHPRGLHELASIHTRMGHPGVARAVFARADTANEHFAAYRALRYIGTGNADSAFIWFDRVKEWGIPTMVSLSALRQQAAIRDDPRYSALLQRLGLAAPAPTAVTTSGTLTR